MAGKSRLRMLCLLVVLAVLVPPKPVAAADRLPDLGMAQITDLRITRENGRRLLRFSTRIVNVGLGVFEAHGQRPSLTTPEMTVVQRIYSDAGGSTDVATTARMFFAGDGHNHWHMRDLQSYELERLDNGVKVGTGAKSGFCFYDNVNYRSLPDHPANPVYTSANSCSGGASALTTAMGLSIGWGDIYYWNLAYQYIDITGLTAGRYQLNVTINTGLGLQETNPANNSTWVKIQLKSKEGASFSIIEYGPSA